MCAMAIRNKFLKHYPWNRDAESEGKVAKGFAILVEIAGIALGLVSVAFLIAFVVLYFTSN